MAETRGAGVQLKALHRSHHDPYQAIIEAAALSHCESGITGALLGSETVKVLTPGLSAEWTGVSRRCGTE